MTLKCLLLTYFSQQNDHFEDWGLLVKHLEFEGTHNSWLYCFTNPLELGMCVSLSHRWPYVTIQLTMRKRNSVPSSRRLVKQYNQEASVETIKLKNDHFNGLDWSLLVKHLAIEDIHNSWLYCFTNPFKLAKFKRISETI